MSLWKISIFEQIGDVEPTKTGYLNASSEAEAASIATDAMGASNRADLQVKAQIISSLPTGTVLWE
jgi:hypothetical protein